MEHQGSPLLATFVRLWFQASPKALASSPPSFPSPCSLPDEVFCRDCTHKLLCLLAFNLVHPRGSPDTIRGRWRVRSEIFDPWIPPCKVASGWLCPMSKVHCTLLFFLFQSGYLLFLFPSLLHWLKSLVQCFRYFSFFFFCC